MKGRKCCDCGCDLDDEDHFFWCINSPSWEEDLEDDGGGTMKGMFPEFKVVKEAQAHCPVCKERLAGNNSIKMPYRCSCGVWKANYANQPIDFTVEGE